MKKSAIRKVIPSPIGMAKNIPLSPINCGRTVIIIAGKIKLRESETTADGRGLCMEVRYAVTVTLTPRNKNAGQKFCANSKDISRVIASAFGRKKAKIFSGKIASIAESTTPVQKTVISAHLKNTRIRAGCLAPKLVLTSGCKESAKPKLMVTPAQNI